MYYECRFIAFTPVRHGCKIRRVSFQEQAVGSNNQKYFPEPGIFKSDYSVYAEIEITYVTYAPDIFRISSKAMEDPAWHTTRR